MQMHGLVCSFEMTMDYEWNQGALSCTADFGKLHVERRGENKSPHFLFCLQHLERLPLCSKFCDRGYLLLLLVLERRCSLRPDIHSFTDLHGLLSNFAGFPALVVPPPIRETRSRSALQLSIQCIDRGHEMRGLGQYVIR